MVSRVQDRLEVFTAAIQSEVVGLLTNVVKIFNQHHMGLVSRDSLRVHSCDAVNTLLQSKDYPRCFTRCKMPTEVNKEASDFAAFSASFIHNRNCLSLN
mmetsp:Transcript_6959/g.8052  ORF Transcript_6959/g.8052 Transcript_6959/m.8052 type:complete len:99 (-) Transcript_6959:907-1203(-)